jgi:AcrR family transcriptional regulator
VARQARSEVTRRKIINAAVDLFSEIGYGSAGLGDIIERAEMTKGALYYHFDSKESLAMAIIEQSNATLMKGFRSITESSAPALESILHGLFVVADIVATDKIARSGTHLLRAFAESNQVAARVYNSWLAEMAMQVRRAEAEGDLRADLDPDVLGESIVGAMLGAEVISQATSGGADLVQRVNRAWEIMLPAVVAEESLPYFREFLAREGLRHSEPSLSID